MFYEQTKRIIDVVLSLIIFVVFSPVFLLVPVIIKITSPGPIFVESSRRVGKDKKLFYMYKFRTMIPNARRITATDPKFKKLLEEYKKNSYKLKNDPRVTPIGHFLRRFSLDELPQAINILRGDMSIVGPRAYYPDELDEQQKVYPQTKKYVQELLTVKPGVTGFWQVNGRSDINFDKRVEMDAAYARQKSVLQDIIIILKTPWVMINGKGAL